MPNDMPRTLGLKTWPFGVVPDPSETLIWADRSVLLNQLTRTLHRLTGKRDSTVQLLWADFGAGKTHTLLYLRQLALSEYGDYIYPIYVALPKEVRSFVDLYRAVVSSLTLAEIVGAYSRVSKSPGMAQTPVLIGEKWHVLLAVLKGLSLGSDAVKQVARKWLLAEQSLSSRELAAASLPEKIRTADDAIGALSGIFRLLSECNFRVLLMVDEFQRTGNLRHGLRSDLQAALHTFFNNCPKGLTMLLSFKFGGVAEIDSYLSKELRDRADPQVITIPVFDEADACQFLSDLIGIVAIPNEDVKIEPEAADALIYNIASVGKLKSRLISKTANLIFAEGAMDLGAKLITSIDSNYVNEKFEQFRSAIVDISKEDE